MLKIKYSIHCLISSDMFDLSDIFPKISIFMNSPMTEPSFPLTRKQTLLAVS